MKPQAVSRPKEFVEIVVVLLVEMVRFGFSALGHNIINWFNNIVQKVTSIQTPGLGVALALDVLFHHLVVKEPNALGHMAEIASFSPDAEIEDQIHNTACHCGGCRHGSVHLGKMRTDSHGTAPLDIIREDLGVQGVDRTWGLDGRRQDVAAHVSTVVTEKDEQVLGLVADRRILETKEVAQIFARRVNHVSVFREAGRKVGGIEHVEGLGHWWWVSAVQKSVFHLAFGVFSVVSCLRHRSVPTRGSRTECLGEAQTTEASIAIGNQTSHQEGSRQPHHPIDNAVRKIISSNSDAIGVKRVASCNVHDVSMGRLKDQGCRDGSDFENRRVSHDEFDAPSDRHECSCYSQDTTKEGKVHDVVAAVHKTSSQEGQVDSKTKTGKESWEHNPKGHSNKRREDC
mmetsp:Transcript_15232/g.38355  ORF Transcript_15232/g.38355 Transcript_15232/m.38355 type:complete len:400 (+) Transcript_15232:3872-5071(+)